MAVMIYCDFCLKQVGFSTRTKYTDELKGPIHGADMCTKCAKVFTAQMDAFIKTCAPADTKDLDPAMAQLIMQKQQELRKTNETGVKPAVSSSVEVVTPEEKQQTEQNTDSDEKSNS